MVVMLQIIEGKMKSLLEFKSIVEEEKSDYSKFDALVRAGLANKAQLQRIHKILDKMSEEKPVFNNADREIMRNLFNRMADLISNNKQIFTQARRVVREDLNEAPLDSVEQLTVPMVLVLRRKAIRLYPDGTRVALYWNDKLKKIFTVPYNTPAGAVIQAEQYIDELREAEEILLNDGNCVELNEETKQLIIDTYYQLDESYKQLFWEQLIESEESFESIHEFCRQHNS